MAHAEGNRLSRLFSSRRADGRGRFRWLRWGVVALGAIACIYLGYAYIAFGVFWGRDIHYPREVIQRMEGAPSVSPSAPSRASAVGVTTTDVEPEECGPSRTVAMQIALIDQIAVRNVWVPARPLYKAGLFGLVSFEATPFLDNKAAEQLGILDIARRLGIELTDSLGRIRGTSEVNEQLNAAQAALRIDETAWFVNNPLNPAVNTISPSAASSYERAVPLYTQYNADLASCAAVFDTRSDNLRETLSRFTATLGSTTTELRQRSRETVYDVRAMEFIEGGGVNAGWFDFRADNAFYRARGKMYALHGILMGMRHDFSRVLSDRNVHAVWDKMEQSVAEAAHLQPLIVSNAAPDAFILPNHLAAMGQMILRARTSMVEVRDILSE